MASKWIQGAVKHPGVFSAAAKKAGMTTHAYAEAHKGDRGVLGRRARLALTFEGMASKRKPSAKAAVVRQLKG